MMIRSTPSARDLALELLRVWDAESGLDVEASACRALAFAPDCPASVVCVALRHAVLLDWGDFLGADISGPDLADIIDSVWPGLSA